MTDGIRKEHRHVEFPGATWTAFDRYSRYGAIVRALRATLGAGPLRVLDVGDGSRLPLRPSTPDSRRCRSTSTPPPTPSPAPSA